MPIPNTKYNYNSGLHIDLSNTSFVHSNHILTCDISDTLFNGEPLKVYLNSKAAFYMHPYSKVRNCTTKFNNEKTKFQYKAPTQCHSCVNDLSSSLNEIQTQKIIQNQVRVPSSLYTMNLGSLYINSDNPHNNKASWHNASDREKQHNKGIDIKHNSYARYLGRKKSQYLKTQPISTQAAIPLMGNKRRNFSIVNCTKIC